MRQFNTFYLDEALFGIDIFLVRELNRLLQFTPVPDGPEHVKGLLNLRGQVITVFDLGKRLGMPGRKISSKTRNIILKTDTETAVYRRNQWLDISIGDDPVGFLVDRIGDVVEVEEGKIQSPPANAGDIATEFVSGVVELPENLLILLNVTRLVGEP
ncbi:MAG: chemotaxis protein CheW [Pseudomonadota bacterium]